MKKCNQETWEYFIFMNECLQKLLSVLTKTEEQLTHSKQVKNYIHLAMKDMYKLYNWNEWKYVQIHQNVVESTYKCLALSTGDLKQVDGK